MINHELKFFDHEPYTVGIEEEYMICDSISGDLLNRASDIMNNLEDNLKSRFSYELIESEIESNTPICLTVNESIEEVIKLRTYLRKIGSKYNYRLGISGTHPTAIPSDQKFVNNDSYNWYSTL